VGYGRNADAYHITAPSPGGEGAAACMQLALDDAGLSPADLSHVNAHGTSTPLNDAAEAEAIRKVFGEAAPPVTSTKGVTGHLVGAAGATEAVACLLALRSASVPPTANLEQIGDDIQLDIVSGEPRSITPAPALSNSFGFGGHNASLIFAPTP
jgi:3-oxoacyl-[acyl-carrier-protein] synthase II